MESDVKNVPFVAHPSFVNSLTQQPLGIYGLKYKEPSPGESRGVGIGAGISGLDTSEETEQED